MKFLDKKDNHWTRPFNYHSMERPWGYYTNYMDNNEGCVKILYMKKGEGTSLQFHFKRDQLYVVLDEGFVITDGETEYLANVGDTFGFQRGVHHRAEYLGPNEYGRFLDIAYGKNDEEDIVRLGDKFGRASGKNIPFDVVKKSEPDGVVR